jgi:hypothetical protein
VLALSRFIRLYEKKRGDRRTGSQAFGNLGEALFFGFFFAVGCLAFGLMFSRIVWQEWRANRQFAAAQCMVIGKELVKTAPAKDTATTYRPEIRIRYTVEGRVYTSECYEVTQVFSDDLETVEQILAGFEVGHEYTCWYDPLDPRRAVLVRGYSFGLYLLLLVPISFIAIGGGGLVFTFIHWNTSAERRALMAQRAAQLDLFEVDSPDRSFPTVPAEANVTNSPGTTLAYRLPITTTTTWTLFAAATACLLWNAIVAIFVVMAIRSHTSGEPNWMLTLFVVPLVAGGIGLVAFFARQFLIATRVGPTRIEISQHPLAPGHDYEILLTQAGRLTFKSLEVWLACEEQAAYRQGTDTRTETRRVFNERCFLREDFQILQGLPFEERCRVQVPEGAMHSFLANHNAVRWKLIVKGDVAGWRPYERAFHIVVSPANGQVEHEPSTHQAEA